MTAPPNIVYRLRRAGVQDELCDQVAAAIADAEARGIRIAADAVLALSIAADRIGDKAKSEAFEWAAAAIFALIPTMPNER